MDARTYQQGDDVEVETPHGFKAGRVVDVIENYAWTGETRYLIHGKLLETITSARLIRPVLELPLTFPPKVGE